jgi:hypothetical protein
MTLNNMVDDDSFLHETCPTGRFEPPAWRPREPALPGCGSTAEDFGLYLNLENLDKIDLERRFGPFVEPQHLYEGESGVEVEPGREGEFEVDEGTRHPALDHRSRDRLAERDIQNGGRASVRLLGTGDRDRCGRVHAALQPLLGGHRPPAPPSPRAAVLDQLHPGERHA